MPHALVVYNPASGSAADADLWLGSVIHRACEKYTVTVLPMRADTQPDEIFTTIKNDVDLIIAAGGDGTIRFVLGALAAAKSTVPVGLLPMGTGNQLCRNLGVFDENLLVDTLHESLQIIFTGEPRPIDLGLMNGEYFCVAAGAGPLSDAILLPEQMEKANWKMLAYAGSVLQTFGLEPVMFRITLPHETFKIAAAGIFVTNISDLGIGTLSETADLNDGLLDLCILNPTEFQDYVEMGFRFAGAFVTGEAPYYIRKVSNVTIEATSEPIKLSRLQKVRRRVVTFFAGQSEPTSKAEKKVTAMIDGDACGTTPMVISVVPNAVNVIVRKGFGNNTQKQ
ncbi:MAG TPA: diacylglycerol kinase family protein [Oculatellaceae cyanobacterium]